MRHGPGPPRERRGGNGGPPGGAAWARGPEDPGPAPRDRLGDGRRAGVQYFRVHDWRHAWTVDLVMARVDLESLRRLGGWEDLRMVQRYAAVSAEHLRTAARKVA